MVNCGSGHLASPLIPLLQNWISSRLEFICAREQVGQQNRPGFPNRSIRPSAPRPSMTRTRPPNADWIVTIKRAMQHDKAHAVWSFRSWPMSTLTSNKAQQPSVAWRSALRWARTMIMSVYSVITIIMFFAVLVAATLAVRVAIWFLIFHHS